MPRNTPIEASPALIDRQSYHDWLHPPSIGEDPLDINYIIHTALSATDRDLLLAAHYEQLSYREIAERFEHKHKSSALFAVKRAEKRLRRKIEWHRKHPNQQLNSPARKRFGKTGQGSPSRSKNS